MNEIIGIRGITLASVLVAAFAIGTFPRPYDKTPAMAQSADEHYMFSAPTYVQGDPAARWNGTVWEGYQVSDGMLMGSRPAVVPEESCADPDCFLHDDTWMCIYLKRPAAMLKPVLRQVGASLHRIGSTLFSPRPNLRLARTPAPSGVCADTTPGYAECSDYVEAPPESGDHEMESAPVAPSDVEPPVDSSLPEAPADPVLKDEESSSPADVWITDDVEIETQLEDETDEAGDPVPSVPEVPAVEPKREIPRNEIPSRALPGAGPNLPPNEVPEGTRRAATGPRLPIDVYPPLSIFVRRSESRQCQTCPPSYGRSSGVAR